MIATRFSIVILLLLVLLSVSAAAGSAHGDPTTEEVTKASSVARPAIETNALWPFFPGGLFDLKLLVPVTRMTTVRPGSGRVELIAGVFSDFAWRFVRDETYGRVSAMGVKLGARVFYRYGLHVESVMQLNWRHEEDRPGHDGTLDGAQGRLWGFAGYQRDISERLYLASRVGAGLHLFRTDELGSTERSVAVGADLNIGLRF